MEKLYKLKARLMDVLENDWAEQIMRKQSIGLGDIELLHKLTDTIKNIDKICMLEDDGGYSHDDGMDYGRGASYARSRSGRPVHRNNMGRYSRDDGRSKMMEHIEAALDAADNKDQEAIKRFMRQLENA